MSEPIVATWSAVEEEAALATKRALLFQLGSATYGLSVELVEKVIELPDVTPVPGAEPWLMGVAVHELLPYPMIDIRQLLSLDNCSPTALKRAIVVTSAHGNALIAVEQLVTISDLSARPVVEVSRDEFPDALIEYICQSEETLVGVLSVPALFKAALKSADNRRGSSH